MRRWHLASIPHVPQMPRTASPAKPTGESYEMPHPDHVSCHKGRRSPYIAVDSMSIAVCRRPGRVYTSHDEEGAHRSAVLAMEATGCQAIAARGCWGEVPLFQAHLAANGDDRENRHSTNRGHW